MLYSYKVEQAIRAAAVLHNEQVRKGSAPFPYITHPYAVALLAADYSDEEEVFIAALLHDTVEDTDYTLEEVQQDFGGKVRDYVESLTEVSHNKDGQKLPWKARKQTYIKKLKDAQEGALIVAAADKIHNMRTMIEEYYEDHARFMADFGSALDDRLLVYQEIANILNRRLKNEIIHEYNHVFDEYKSFIKECANESI